MQESEYDSVAWDIRAADDEETSAGIAKGTTSTQPSPFGGMGGNSQEFVTDGDARDDPFGDVTVGSRNGKLAASSVLPFGADVHAFDPQYNGESSKTQYKGNSVGETNGAGSAGDDNGEGADPERWGPNIETQITVEEPRKEGEGTSNPYVTYLVKTIRTNSKTKEIRKYALRRRFQDFVWLHEQLSREFLSCVIPPLPGKYRLEYIKGDRFSEEFVSRRKYGLERFLKRIALHPKIRTSKYVVMFLETKDWGSEYESRPKSENGVLDSISDTFLNTFSKVRKKDVRFIEMRENIARLEDNLSRTQKLYLRVIKRQQELQAAYEELGTGLCDLGDIETGMALALVEVGNALKAHHVVLKKLADQTEDIFLGEIEEYITYCEAYKELLRLRDQKQAEFEDLSEYLLQTTTERDRLTNHQSAAGMTAVTNFIKGKVRDLRGVDPAISRQQRIQNLSERMSELQAAVETSNEDSVAFSDLVAGEYDVFAFIKRNDFKRAFSALAQFHIDFYTSAVDIWKSVIPELEKLPTD